MKRFLISSIVFSILFLTACLSPSGGVSTPTATGAPSETPSPTPTETPTPTPSGPTIEVDGLQLPDPKAANPELFSLTNPDSPIVQFANAFGIKPEEVGDLTPQLLTGVDGKQFIVLTTGDLPQTADFDESGTPLMIAKQGENGEWSWNEANLKNIADQLGIDVGTFLGGYGFADYYKDLIKLQEEYFNSGTMLIGMEWNYPTQEGGYNFRDLDYDYDLGKKYNMNILGHSLIWPSEVPDWLKNGNFNETELRTIMKDWVTTVMQRYPEISVFNVINEPYLRDVFQQKLGDDYVFEVFQWAREARPDATLIFNHFANHSTTDAAYPNGQYTNASMELARQLSERGLIDGVGIQMVLFADDLPSEEDITQTLKNYPVPVYITEFQVIMTNVPGSESERMQRQAEIYQMVTRAILNSENVRMMTFPYQSDKVSAWENSPNLPQYSPNADTTLFDDNYQPKPGYFAILSSCVLAAIQRGRHW